MTLLSPDVGKRETTAPLTFFFLVLPYGISSGFVSITLPFVLVRAGFSVAMSTSIVAIGVSANLWRFLWGPVADLTLTARKWYLIGLATAAVTLSFLGFIPLRQNAVEILMAMVFISWSRSPSYTRSTPIEGNLFPRSAHVSPHIAVARRGSGSSPLTLQPF